VYNICIAFTDVAWYPRFVVACCLQVHALTLQGVLDAQEKTSLQNTIDKLRFTIHFIYLFATHTHSITLSLSLCLYLHQYRLWVYSLLPSTHGLHRHHAAEEKASVSQTDSTLRARLQAAEQLIAAQAEELSTVHASYEEAAGRQQALEQQVVQHKEQDQHMR
jgi:hypothetical protein